MLILLLLLLLLYFYFPYVSYDSIDISPDFLLLVIIFSSIQLSRSRLLLLSFIIGTIKDILTQYYFFGFLSLITTIFGYSIAIFNPFKKNSFNYILMIFFIFIYFFISYNLKYSESYLFYFKFSCIKSIVTFFSFFLFNTIFIKTIQKFEK